VPTGARLRNGKARRARVGVTQTWVEDLLYGDVRAVDIYEADILRLSDDGILSRVDNIEEMVRNVERHADDDQYCNGELAKVQEDDQRL
jgi:hypothetical protein